MRHGGATFANVGSDDLSLGIDRGTAGEMQSEAELQLRHQIRDTVQMLRGDKKTVGAVREQIAELKAEMFNQSAMNGADGARQARMRIRERKKQEMQEIEVFKANLTSANLSPMLVAKLSDLVSPGNTEIPNSYMIKSKLSDKDDARIKNLLRKDYF